MYLVMCILKTGSLLKKYIFECVIIIGNEYLFVYNIVALIGFKLFCLKMYFLYQIYLFYLFILAYLIIYLSLFILFSQHIVFDCI